MKKFLLLVFATVALTSCYTTKVCVGDIQPNTPTVLTNTIHNQHFIYGLVPGKNAELEAKNYVGNEKSYIVSKKITFVDGLLSGITFGIYTPTTTSFYLPYKK